MRKKINLRVKTLSLVVGLFVASAVVLIVIVASILLKSYAEIEDQSANRDLQRLQKVFSADLKQIFTIIEDYASWDDTYEFARNPNQAYIKSNLEGDTFLALVSISLCCSMKKGGNCFQPGTTLKKERPYRCRARFFNS